MKLFSIEDIREAEKSADSLGHPYTDMMELAGVGIVDAIAGRVDVVGKEVLVLVGAGNNGGDGLVAAHHLLLHGATVTCFLTKPRTNRDKNFERVQQNGVELLSLANDEQLHILKQKVASCDVLIDGLLGIGVTRPIAGEMEKLLRTVKSAVEDRTIQKPQPFTTLTNPLCEENEKPYIVAIDVPSGVNADSGIADPLSLKADLTVTFAGPKLGHFRFPAADLCGELVIVDIGIPIKQTSHLPVNVGTPRLMRMLLPKRPINGHKGIFGNVLVVGGSRDYLGAPVLAGRGALRAGAGVVSLAVPNHVRTSAASSLPEASYPHLPDEETLTALSVPRLTNQINNADVMLVGPGLGQADTFLHVLLERPQLPPLVVDADALNILSRSKEWYKRLPPHCILTPHPGEMARLLQVGTEELTQLDRIGLAMETAVSWNQIVVLKGAYTIIASPNDTATIIPIAHPALAVGGSGDVLAGVIAAFVAQGLAPYDAARLGAYVHGLSGKLSADGDAGLLAREIADGVPAALKMLA